MRVPWANGSVPGRLAAASAILGLMAAGFALSGPGAAGPARAGAGARPIEQQADGPQPAIADPGDIAIATAVTFDAGPSQGDLTSYSWDFGDGTGGATGKTAKHTYTLVNDYTVSLTTQDRQGGSAAATRKVRVVPAFDTLIGRPELGQITPAASFTAMLSMNAAGPAQLSVKLGGSYLYSDRWDFVGGNSPTLLEVPDVRVVNEDDTDLADLMAERVAAIPLTNAVTVTVSYPVSSGDMETASYTTTLLKPPGFVAPQPPVNTSTPVASTSATPAPSPSPAGTGTPNVYLKAALAATSAPPPGPPPPPPPLPGGAGGARPGGTPAAATPPPAASAPAAATAYWSITYPSYLSAVGLPANADDVDSYYTKGDKDFHAVDDSTVRRYAIKIARNGGVFPNDPQRAADNIYRYVNGLLGIGDPGDLLPDTGILGRLLDGTLVSGARRGQYICIAHAYFVSSLTRTLGLPTRELTIGFGRGRTQNSDGAWNLSFYQEGANEVWYAGAWHHYDTWIGTRDRADYLDTSLTEVAWYAYSTQTTPFIDENGSPLKWKGHDFSIGKYVGTPGSPEQWRFLEQQTRPGIRLADPGPDAYASVERAPHAPAPDMSAPSVETDDSAGAVTGP